MASRYEEALADSELVALRDELALADARLSDLLQRVDSGETGRLWHALKRTYDLLREAEAAGNHAMVAAKVRQAIPPLLSRVAGYY